MLDIKWSTLILQIFNFLVMVFILARFFFKPVVRILDERSKKVTSALDEAEKREKEAADMHAEYEIKLAEAQEQVVSMRQQAQDELEQTKKKFLDEARQEIQAMRDKTTGELEEARQQAILQHRRDLGRLVTTLSGKLIREAGGSIFQSASIEHFLEQLGTLPADQVRRAVADSQTQVMHVQLVSAEQLDSDNASRIEAQLRGLAEQPIEMIYKVDPSLVAGATVRFGDTVIDGSLAGQLQSLGERYLADLEQGQV